MNKGELYNSRYPIPEGADVVGGFKSLLYKVATRSLEEGRTKKKQ